jgi:hypothetical protein
MLDRSDDAREYLRTGGMLLTLLGGITFGPTLAPSRASEAFYATAAQVIPVLLLVLALERRLFWLGAPSWPGLRNVDWDWARGFVEASVLAVTLSFFLVGEMRAFNALSDQLGTESDPWTVYTALLLGVLMVGFIAVFGPPRRTRDKP